jgi:hypothetical protein
MQPHHKTPLPLESDEDTLQDAGDIEAARRHRESLESFVESGQVEDAARDAEPQTTVEEVEMFEAERIGEAHSKGEDPALKHAPPRKP